MSKISSPFNSWLSIFAAMSNCNTVGTFCAWVKVVTKLHNLSVVLIQMKQFLATQYGVLGSSNIYKYIHHLQNPN